MDPVAIEVLGPYDSRMRCPACERAMRMKNSFLPPLRKTCPGCGERVTFFQSPLQQLASTSDPELAGQTLAFPARWRANRLDDAVDYARGEWGIEFANQAGWTLDLAALDHMRWLWRNSPLESVHAGDYDDEGISEANMMRFNIATWRAIRETLTVDELVPEAMGMVLLDPDRLLPGGWSARIVLGAGWDDYRAHVEVGFTGLRDMERIEADPEYVRYHLAHRGLASCSTFFGSPVWPSVVDAFLDSASAPVGVDPAGLRDQLLHRPEGMGVDTIEWCLREGLGWPDPVELRRRWAQSQEPDLSQAA